MESQDIWWSYWYFHFPNYAFSVLVYTLFGRFALGFFLPPGSPNYIYRWFCRLTNPVLRPIAFITPRALHGPVLVLVAAFWVQVLRVAFFALLYSAGLTPRLPGSAS